MSPSGGNQVDGLPPALSQSMVLEHGNGIFVKEFSADHFVSILIF